MNAETESHSHWAERLEVVAELASLINTTFDLDEIFRAAILKIRQVLEFRRASVVLVSFDRQTYHLHTLYDVAQGGFVKEEASFPIERGLTGEAIQTGEAIRVDAFAGTEGIRAGKEQNISALIVPLKVGEEVIGTLNFGAEESATYDDEDLELAVLLGRQIATSLYYSKLLATIQAQREALEREHVRVQAERSRLEALIDASDAAILMVSGDRVAYANRAMAGLLGLPQEVIISGSMEEINRVLARSFADREALSTQIAALQSGGAPLSDRVEFEFPRRLVCQRTVATVRGTEDEVLGQIVLYRDVTAEAEAEATKSEFVSLVSHELRTPLTSVKTSLNLLVRGAAGAISDGVRDLMEIALRNLDRLIRLVDDLLDLSRIESGRVVAKLEPISVDEAAARAIDAVIAFAEEQNVSIEIEEPEPDTLVIADADRLQQVFVNLLSNAVKFSPAGGRVKLSWWRQADQAVLRISDEGPGIPADQLEEIFEKFRQLERTETRSHGGAGLGLAICRSIVEQFGGDMWAESEEGTGSRFFVRLRLAYEAPKAEEAGPAVPPGPRTVLLLEKDPDLGQLLRVQFEGDGWAVLQAARGADGLEKVRSEEVDLVVSGLELEDVHGLELLQRLRGVPDTVDIPALLAGPGGDLSQAVAYGADGWMVGDADALVAEANRLVSAPRRRVVLLIEDDPAVRVAVARGLRRAGYACLEVASGERGLAFARQRPPDLLLTDIEVPEMDGLEVLREFRGDPRLVDVPAIVITGRASSETMEAIHSLRARVVSKPFGPATVVREVERLLGTGSVSS
ncbi:MAG: response regulator [Gemmatimonadota bacterium]|nr:MAG: response regulator [Gemmatimonadota bacterium]